MRLRSMLKTIPLLYDVYNLRNGFWKKGLKVTCLGRKILIKKIKVVNKGKNNRLYIGNGTRINGVSLHIYGDDNSIYIGEQCIIYNTHFSLEDNNNKICVGEKTSFNGKVELCAIEGTTLEVGRDCMFSSDIYISTGDSHSVCIANTNIRTNISEDVRIGEHVWVGTRVLIGKGCDIADGAIVAQGAVCNKKIEKEPNAVYAGNPATLVKKGVNWKRERIQ